MWVISPASLCSRLRKMFLLSLSLSLKSWEAVLRSFGYHALIKSRFLRERARRKEYDERSKKERERERWNEMRDAIAKNCEHVYADDDIFWYILVIVRPRLSFYFAINHRDGKQVCRETGQKKTSWDKTQARAFFFPQHREIKRQWYHVAKWRHTRRSVYRRM